MPADAAPGGMTEQFRTPNGPVPAVTAAEMREVDRVAVEETGPALLGMMENAGRGLARAVREFAGPGPVTVLAGGGGNGGGGLAAARHLANHGRGVRVVADRDPETFEGATATQWATLAAMGVERVAAGAVGTALPDASAVIDALVGYSLEAALGGTAADLAAATADAPCPVVSLDVPTGVDATSGERPGPSVDPDRTVTLGLPKTGLSADHGDLLLADVGIPPAVYERAGVDCASPFEGTYLLPLEPV